jgi:alpha-1,2-rhamnosyltransferase
MDDVTDTELDYCYTHAKALLFSAIVEGFGLPIIEALHKGLPVFASDIPVFHEVGGAYVSYFDQTTPASLVSLLQAYEASGTFPAKLPTGFTWPGWSASTAELITRLTELVSSGKYVEADKCAGVITP